MLNLKSIYKESVPFRELKSIEIVKSVSLSVGVIYLILALLEPFDFSVSDYNKYIVLLIFSLAYFIVLFIAITWMLPFIVKLAKIKTLRIYHFVLGYLGLSILVTTTHYILQNYFNDAPLFDFKMFFTFFKNGLVLGLIPAVILSLIDYNRALKLKLKSSSNDLTIALKKVPLEEIVTFSALNEKDVYRFEAKKLLYIKSDDNYVNVFYQNKEDKIEEELIRTTLKKAESQLPFPFIRVHRSYIVNLNQVNKISGNSQGMKLSIINQNTQIPVSRSYVEPLKKILRSL